MRPFLITFYLLLGVYGYFRAQGALVLGYLVLMVPISLATCHALVLAPALIPGRGSRVWSVSSLGRSARKHGVLLALYGAMVVAGFARAVANRTRPPVVGMAEIVLVVTILLFLYAAVKQAIRKRRYDGLLDDVSLSLFAYVSVNVVAAALGVENPGIDAKYNRELESVFGFYRVIYPFTFSGQMFAIEAGMLAVFGVFWWLLSAAWSRRYVGIGMVAASVLVLVGHGARAPILAVLGVLAFAVWWKIFGRHLYSLTLVGLAVITAWVVAGDATVFLESLGEYVGGRFSRQVGDIATLSNRLTIWAVVVTGFVQAGWEQLLLGYGAHGQIASQFSYEYAFLFEYSYAEPYTAPTHNTFLQVLVDYGLVGLGVFTALIVSLVRRIAGVGQSRPRISGGRDEARVIGLVLLYLLTCSITESALTYYATGLWAMFVFVNLYVLFFEYRAGFGEGRLRQTSAGTFRH